MFSYSLSSILTPLLAMYLNSWRVLLAIATLPNLIVVVADLCQFIPESIRWLICKGKHSEAMNILLKIARWNKVRLNVSFSLFIYVPILLLLLGPNRLLHWGQISVKTSTKVLFFQEIIPLRNLLNEKTLF